MTNGVFETIGGEAIAAVGLTVAAALALYWFLRGAPIGQAARVEEGPDAPAPKARDRLAAALTVGAIAVAWGATVAIRFGIGWSIPVFAAGFGILVWTMRSVQRFRHGSPSARRMARFADAWLTGTLLAGILIIANIVAFSYGGRPIDLSTDRSYSLSETTLRQLQALEEPLTFTVVLGRGGQALGQRERIDQLLRLLEAERPGLVSIESLDPYAEPERYRRFAEQVPGLDLATGGGVVLTHGAGEEADSILVRNIEMFQAVAPEDPEPSALETRFLGEAALTSAIIRLRQGERPIVAITTGHGELSVDESDPRRPGLGQLRARLASVGMTVQTFNPIEPVPTGASLGILAGPTDPLDPEAARNLERFVEEEGGRLLVMTGFGLETGLEDWLETQGVTVGPGVVVDPARAYRGRPELPLVTIESRSAHPIVQPLLGRTVLMPNASPLELRAGRQSPDGLFVTPVLQTSARSWAETEPELGAPNRDPQRDPLGPLTVAAAVAARPESPEGAMTPKLVVLSSRFVADNTTAAAWPANLDLVVNALSWLQDRPDLVGIAPSTNIARILQAGPNFRAKLVLLPTMMAVAVLVGLGVTTYLARRE